MSEKNPMDIGINDKATSIHFSKKGVLAALIRTAFDVGQYVISPGTIAEWIKALDLKEPKAKQAFELIAKSLAKTIRKQLGDHYDDQEALDYGLQLKIVEKLEEGTYFFNCKHLKKPEILPLLTDFKDLYKKWLLEEFVFTAQTTDEKIRDFNDAFAIAFFDELKEGSNEAYKALLDWCNDPITADWERNLNRKNYKAQLKDKYGNPALGEKKVALSDVYIEPTFLVFDGMYSEDEQKAIRAKSKEDENVKTLNENDHFFPVDFDGSLHDYFINHFIKSEKSSFLYKKVETNRLMILMGQPGHGKSSFCYRCMNDLEEDKDFNGNYFFIRLQEDPKIMLSNPIEGIKSLVKKHKIDFEDWIDTDIQKNVLFLDGLDEMYMVQGLSDTDVLQFINSCKSLLSRHPNLYIVITSRFNYVETSKLYNDCILFSLGNLDVDQQKVFVDKYKMAKGAEDCNLEETTLIECNKNEEFKHIKELIELPILLQMILISNVDIQNTQSRAEIYNNLFETVLERRWAEGRMERYEDSNKFKPQHLRAYMSLLAFKIFQNNRGYLNKREVEGMKATKTFIQKRLKVKGEDGKVQDVLKDVLTSFYIKETPREKGDHRKEDEESEYAIEFLHKSLYEYLTCEYLWNATKAFFLKKDDDGDFESYETSEVQQKIQELFSKIRLREEMMEHLKGIIDEDNAEHTVLMQQMAKYLPKLVRQGFLQEYKSDDKCKYNAHQQELNCFHGFWVIFGQLNQFKLEGLRKKYFGSDWKDFTNKFLQDLDKTTIISRYKAFNERNEDNIRGRYNTEVLISEMEEETQQFEKWMQEEYLKPASPKYLKFENWLRDYFYKKNIKAFFCERTKATEGIKVELADRLRTLAAERFSMKLNFDFVDFSKIDLRNILAIRINLSRADLSSADLSSADLSRADLSSADLSRADLSRAYLRSAYLSSAYLRSAYLSSAYLSSADLSRAYLSEANLLEANLQNVILLGARVHRNDWIVWLKTQQVKGLEYVEKKYRVSEEMKEFRNRWGGKYEAYEVLEK